MFKLESYVTPLLLSYVDKYIKNLKPEDSQLSLWGGDASFCNLDLRLDVLEKELDLPFTFVNGHIHELRIHVPWTKLGSEPVVITINTIECILKLHTENDVDEGASRMQASGTASLSKKLPRKQDAPEAPPGYVQGLINRVLGNICIICNNLILKYVEDDIVLSLNIKSAELYNVNEKWERSFIDTYPALVVRKIINMQDLTVCLDKRDGSGKIETYQDPLLYRCSTVWRLYNEYDIAHSKCPAITRINMYCDQLGFSLTDQQLPMFLRLMKLCYALHCKNYCLTPKKQYYPEDADYKSESCDDETDPIDMEAEGWGSWAWSYIPQVFPVWTEDDAHNTDFDSIKSRKIFQFGIFIDKASCVFKTTETVPDSCYGSPKFSFTPFAILHQYGCSVELTVKGKEFLNFQLGMTCATVCGLGKCVCGCKYFSDNPRMEKPFLRAGVPLNFTDAYNFLSSTLFDPLAPENCEQKRDYCFDQQLHLSKFSEEVLVKKFPAVAFDYVYELQIPDEWIDKVSLVTTTFLEESNWRENSVCRFVVGPSCTDIDSSMVHFIEKLIQSSKDYDYPPYFSLESGIELPTLENTNVEDIQCMEEYVPSRSYHLTCFKPVLRLFAADHSNCDGFSKSDKKKLRKKKQSNSFKETVSSLSILKISTECIDFQLHTPMYPAKMSRIVNKLVNPSENLLYHCSNNFSFKLFGAKILLLKYQNDDQIEKTLIPSFSATLFKKSLCKPEHWINQKDILLEEYNFECNHTQVILTEPLLFTLLYMYQSWTIKDFMFDHGKKFSSMSDHIKGNAVLCCSIKGMGSSVALTQSVVSCKVSVSSICITLHKQEHFTVLLCGPEYTSDIYKGSQFVKQLNGNKSLSMDNVEVQTLFQLLLQFPRKTICDAWLLFIHMSGVTVCMEPAIINWFSHGLSKCLETNGRDNSSLVSPTSFEGSSTCSSATPIASGSLSVSQYQSIRDESSIDNDMYKNIQKYLLQNYNIFKNLKLQVKFQSIIILIPNASWCVLSEENSTTLECWTKAFNNQKLITASIICFPEVTVKSSSCHFDFEQISNIDKMKLPINYAAATNKDLDFFPWIFEIMKFCVYTIDSEQNKENIFFFWSPSSATATLAVTSKSNQNQLAVCIHVDTTAVNVSCSASQVQLLVNSLNTITSLANSLNVINIWLMLFMHRSERTNYTTISKNTHDATEGAVFKEVKLSGNEEQSNPVNEEMSDSSRTVSKLIKKVTLWFQLTLSKCSISFFGSFESTNPMYFQCQFITEEVITSLDIQDVYSKGKVKVSAMNINYYLKNSANSDWGPGLHDGVVLCSNHKLRRNIINSGDNIADHSNASTESQPFLLITYTRALSIHAKQKWTEVTDEDCIVDSASKYISELDINVKSFDLILWVFLFKTIYDAYTPLNNVWFIEYLMKPRKHEYLNSPTGINFSNQTLPLLYVNTSSVRIFFPKTFIPYSNVTEGSSESSKNVSSNHTCNISPDMLLLYVDHISVTSQVENPLARIILNADLYEAALNSKTLMLPGSDIEDRQYQLDIYGLTIGSVISTDITVNHSTCELPKGYMQIMGENPALEWNIGVVNESRKQCNGEPLLINPILSTVDIKFAVAPAIVSKNFSSEERIENVISGITVEISIVSEIFIYFSARQLELLNLVIDNCQNLISPAKQKIVFNERPNRVSTFRLPSNDILQDSGVESETSTFILFDLPDIPVKSNDTYDFVPFEVLITAGSISVILFVHEEDVGQRNQVKKFNYDDVPVPKYYMVSESPFVSTVETFANSNYDYSSVQSNMKKTFHDCQKRGSMRKKQLNSLNPQSMHTIYPIVLISVTQPHSFLKVYTSSQRFEISCFDINVRGSSSNYIITSSSSVIVPTVADFPIVYLETKPGEVDEKTGIPPAFWTITCTDFLHLPSKMQMRLERPVKFIIGSCLLNKLELVHKSFTRKTDNLHVVANRYDITKFHGKSQNINSTDCSNVKFGLISLFEKVDLCTTQIVVEADFKETGRPISLNISLDILKGEFLFESMEQCIKSSKIHLNITGLAYKVLVSEEVWPFLFPVSMTLTLNCQLEPYFHLKVSVKGETVFINFRLKHFVAQLEVVKYIIKKLRSEMPLTFSKNPQDTSLLYTSNESTGAKKLYWHDDLRKGSFYFNQTFNQTSAMPEVYEIIFSKAGQNQPAAMTWRYPQPRVLTKVEVLPVPFHCTIDQQLSDNTLQMVTCYIQFWDSLHNKFVNKCNFQLSEAVHNNLEFPTDNNVSIEFSDIWRVILDYGETFNCDLSKSDISLLSPFALAACLCIDSCFDPSIIPSTQFVFSLSLIKINLYNHYLSSHNSYGEFQPFTFDDAIPNNQEFLSLSIEKPNFYYGKWSTGFKVEGCFEVGCDILEYKNLTMMPFFNSFDIQIDGHACYKESNLPVLELEMIFQPCFIRITQSVIHTLKFFIHHSSLELNEMANLPLNGFSFPNYYIICNNTQESLRFGQVDTEENIFLPSQKMHAYSWRSHKCDQKLQISLKCNKWVWSEPFFIETCGLQKVYLGNDINVHVKIKSLSNLQKQIIIEGELIMYNFLNLELIVKFSIINPTVIDKTSTIKSCTHNLKKSSAVTFVVSRSDQVKMCLSLNENTSSKWINIMDENTYELISIQEKEMTEKNLLVQICNKMLKSFHFILISISPSYIIRNYLPCAVIKDEKLSRDKICGLVIEGKGRETQFWDDLNFSQDIKITFQKTSFMKTSIPAFKILQLEKEKFFNKSNEVKLVEKFLLSEVESTSLLKNHQSHWPFCSVKNFDSLSVGEMRHYNNQLVLNPTAIQPDISNPKIVVETKYEGNGLNSIYVDVKPWALFFNKTEVDFFFIDLNKREYCLLPNAVIMPPFISECFYLAIEFENEKFLSSPLCLLEEKSSKHVTIEGEIPQTGAIDIIIPIQTKQVKVCIFRIKSEIHDGIRILTILPLVHFKNNTNHEFTLSLCVTQAQSCNLYSSLSKVEVKNPSQSSMNLTFWGSDMNDNYSLLSHGNTQIKFYIALNYHNDRQEPHLSYALCFSPDLPIDMRHTFAFPSTLSNPNSLPFVLTSHQREGFWYFVISCDPSPLMLLHNRTSILFFYGQNVNKPENITVFEELKTNLPLPSLAPGQSSYYTFPDLQKQFPKLVDPLPKIRLGCEDKTTQSCVWSPSIDINVDNQFVCIPEICYVKISRKRIGHAINIFIDLVNRIEFTANEIRSRIGIVSDRTLHCTKTDTQLENHTLKKPEYTQKTNASQKKVTDNFETDYTAEHLSEIPFSLCITVRASHVSLAICDELKNPKFCSEVVRFNMQDTLLFLRSNEKSQSVYYIYEICFCIGDFQIDNQIDQEDNIVYDFPIILKQHCINKQVLEDFSPQLPNKAREKAFMAFEATFEIQPVEKTFIFQVVKISFKPMSIYFEDVFYYKILNLYKTYLPPNIQYPLDYRFLNFPEDVMCMVTAFIYPVRIKYLKIDFPEIYLSVHASLKLYLSIENSLLKFQPFSKSEIFTNYYELGRIAIIHYLTGALFRAGWVVGSLDLLGNPANFARAIGSGIADFVLLPYHGFLNGPRAFISGLTSGAVSLVSGISAGAITCVTNLASSISRNMDLLSLDAEHLAHQEMLRHRLPDGVTSGLLQGLSGLGISLLGAIAGVVDHPLQVLVTPTNTLSTAKGVVGGLGKGILGILTKPVGGAAVFVSQAGRGILHEAGWSVQCKRQYQSYSAQTECFSNSLLKYKWKIFQTSAFGEVLLSIEATHLDENGFYEENVLVLTSEVLCLFNPEEDMQRETFSLSEIKCHMSEKDPSAIVINNCQLQKANLFQEVSDVTDRVADYIQKSCLYKSDAMQYSFDDEANVLNFEFYVQPNLRGLFLALFSLAKRTLHKKGFPMF